VTSENPFSSGHDARVGIQTQKLDHEDTRSRTRARFGIRCDRPARRAVPALAA
jgi:hypothetical protein